MNHPIGERWTMVDTRTLRLQRAPCLGQRREKLGKLPRPNISTTFEEAVHPALEAVGIGHTPKKSALVGYRLSS